MCCNRAAAAPVRLARTVRPAAPPGGPRYQRNHASTERPAARGPRGGAGRDARVATSAPPPPLARAARRPPELCCDARAGAAGGGGTGAPPAVGGPSRGGFRAELSGPTIWCPGFYVLLAAKYTIVIPAGMQRQQSHESVYKAFQGNVASCRRQRRSQGRSYGP